MDAVAVVVEVDVIVLVLELSVLVVVVFVVVVVVEEKTNRIVDIEVVEAVARDLERNRWDWEESACDKAGRRACSMDAHRTDSTDDAKPLDDVVDAESDTYDLDSDNSAT